VGLFGHYGNDGICGIVGDKTEEQWIMTRYARERAVDNENL
jgi:hypothetical protein